MSFPGTSFRSFAVALTLLAAGSVPASADRQMPLCASAQAALAKDAACATALAAVFLRLPRSRKDSDCTYPFALLHFDDADVLLTTAGKPGEACHGCGAEQAVRPMRSCFGLKQDVVTGAASRRND